MAISSMGYYQKHASWSRFKACALVRDGYTIWVDIQPVKGCLGFSGKCLQYEDDDLTVSTDITRNERWKMDKFKDKIRRRDRKESNCPKGMELHHLWFSDKYNPDSFIICTPEEHATMDSNRHLKTE